MIYTWIAKEGKKNDFKKLEPKSRYAEYDTDGDGIVSDEELARHRNAPIRITRRKADSQRRWHGSL